MTYELFQEQVCFYLQDRLGSCADINIKKINKNNQVTLEGLTIMEKEYNLSPTFYLNYYYEDFLKGSSITEIGDAILQAFHQKRPSENLDISFFTDYHRAQTQIVYKLIHFQRNQELLKSIPHIPFLDFAIVFQCLLENPITGSGTILIHNQHLDFWHITLKELQQAAFENTPQLLPPDLRNMTDVLTELMGSGEADFTLSEEDHHCPLFVLTNTAKLHGASCILYKDLLGNFASKMNSDLWIVPSSIHEVLLIPTTYQQDGDDITQMIQEVNATQVADDELLSDHVYHYSRETDQITI